MLDVLGFFNWRCLVLTLFIAITYMPSRIGFGPELFGCSRFSPETSSDLAKERPLLETIKWVDNTATESLCTQLLA